MTPGERLVNEGQNSDMHWLYEPGATDETSRARFNETFIKTFGGGIKAAEEHWDFLHNKLRTGYRFADRCSLGQAREIKKFDPENLEIVDKEGRDIGSLNPEELQGLCQVVLIRKIPSHDPQFSIDPSQPTQ